MNALIGNVSGPHILIPRDQVAPILYRRFFGEDAILGHWLQQ